MRLKLMILCGFVVSMIAVGCGPTTTTSTKKTEPTKDDKPATTPTTKPADKPADKKDDKGTVTPPPVDPKKDDKKEPGK